MLIADGDSLEMFVNVGSEIPGGLEGPRRLWAPDWILMATSAQQVFSGEQSHGILVGHMPQLGPAPKIPSQGVVHAATLRPGPITPGEIITVFGQNLGPAAGSGPVLTSGLRLATDVEQTQVLFDGVAGAILYAGAGQINVVGSGTLPRAESVSMPILYFW